MSAQMESMEGRRMFSFTWGWVPPGTIDQMEVATHLPSQPEQIFSADRLAPTVDLASAPIIPMAQPNA